MLEYFKLDVKAVKNAEEISPFDYLFKPRKIKCGCGKQLYQMNKMLICECGYYTKIK
jgi:hypothetical protein